MEQILKSNIIGKCFNVIVNMYNDIKGKKIGRPFFFFPDFFPCKKGVGQWEGAVPLFIFNVP
jgi:hypothetical protein